MADQQVDECEINTSGDKKWLKKKKQIQKNINLSFPPSFRLANLILETLLHKIQPSANADASLRVSEVALPHVVAFYGSFYFLAPLDPSWFT